MTSQILRAALAMQSLNLLGQNVVVAKKMLKKSKPEKPLKSITKLATLNLIGIPLIRTQGSLIEAL